MSKTTDAISKLVDDHLLAQKRASRDYMGVSGLGSECDRQLWYSYHTPKPVDSAKALRIFEVGHRLEPMMIDMLKGAGLTLWTHDFTEEQIGFTDGVIAGHVDGICKGIPGDENTPYLVEFKTANDFRWKAFVKEGFESDEKYRTQVHVYMHKMNLTKCLAVVMNKNTQEMYYEIIDVDDFHAISAINRGKEIAITEVEPDRKYPTKSFFKCQYCNWKKECWG